MGEGLKRAFAAAKATRKHPAPLAFNTIRDAEKRIAKLMPKHPGRHFAVIHHPKKSHEYAIGIMAGGVLLCGYVTATT